MSYGVRETVRPPTSSTWTLEQWEQKLAKEIKHFESGVGKFFHKTNEGMKRAHRIWCTKRRIEEFKANNQGQ
jgi:hypothetical protein